MERQNQLKELLGLSNKLKRDRIVISYVTHRLQAIAPRRFNLLANHEGNRSDRFLGIDLG